MLECHRAAPEIAIERDEVKPVFARPGTGRGGEEISPRRPPHVSHLARPDRLERSPEAGTASGLDLDESDAVAVTDDEINLDMPEPEISLEYRTPGKLQIERRDALSERTARRVPFHRRHPFPNSPARARDPRVS
jgi:hypothetical protein